MNEDFKLKSTKCKDRPTYIYICCDPNTSECRYVGKTIRSVDYRIKAHVKDLSLNHRANWFRHVGFPDYFVVEIVPPGGDWIEAEQFWIAYMKSLGANLVNMTIGGEGLSGWNHSDKTKHKIRLGHLGKKKGPMPDYHKFKISLGGKGKKRSAETCTKLSIVNTGKKIAPEVIAKIKASKKGKVPVLSEEGRAKIVAAGRARKGVALSEERIAIIAETNRRRCTGVKQTPEHVAKCAAARTGHEVSQETRDKISRANKGTNHREGTRHSEETLAKMSQSAKKRGALQRAKREAELLAFFSMTEPIEWCENE